jgi:methyltransferase (TIGR00027 family)
MQVRTRVLDAVLLEFARDGGTQVVILGAGFDCRALRFARELAQATVYEVDHPATQARKRAVLHGDIGARTDYVAWDFESRDVRELPKELASRGHDARKATLTLWEGVTPYLTVNAIDASVRAVHDYSSRGSRLAFTYFDRTALERPRLRERLVRRFVASVGEPFRFGWRREDVPSWFEQRGFALVRDASMPELAAELLPQRFELQRRTASRRIAIVSRM